MNVNTDVAVNLRKSIRVVAVVLFSSSLLLSAASAQFNSGFPGQMTLPQNDFTWTWGNQRSAGRGMDDFSMFGDDSGFRCDLTGKLRVGSRMSRMDMRELESSIRSSMNFVQAASNAMNQLDGQRELDWAMLKCEKPQQEEKDSG